MIILGCNGGLEGRPPFVPTSRDAAAAILVDGEVVLAVEEERLSRERHVGGFPRLAIEACLSTARVRGLEQVDRVAYACRRMSASDVVAAGGHARSAASLVIDAGLAVVRAASRRGGYEEAGHRLALERMLRSRIPRQRFACVPHALAHTANAFFTSPFERSLCLVSTSETRVGKAVATVVRSARFEAVEERLVPDSLALLNTLIARFLGFQPGEESKLVPLAALGDRSRFHRFFRRVVQTSVDGATQVEPALLSLLAGRALFTRGGLVWPRGDAGAGLLHALGPARLSGEPIEQRHHDIAAALEEAIEVSLLSSLEVLRERTGERYLCLAGELAQNPAVNGRIARSGLFDQVHVAPASHDAGTSLGAAFYVEHVLRASPRALRPAPTPYLGPTREPVSIAREGAVQSSGVRVSRPTELVSIVARGLAQGKIVGWCEGRSEWGTEALGHRSILADPRSATTKERLSRSVKMRHAERPYAPAVLVERAHELFDLTGVPDSPRMLFSVPVRPEHRATLAAVTHADGTARVMTVSSEDTPSLHGVIEEFDLLTGVPVLLNTSLNVDGEPILEMPEDTIHCFLSTGIDMLVVDGVLFEKVSAGNAAALQGRSRVRRQRSGARPIGLRLVQDAPGASRRVAITGP